MLKPYPNAMTGSAMVVIQCPHCGGDVELEDGASGLFECPYCNKDFAWNDGLDINNLKVKFLWHLFGIFSPSLIFFLSFWLMVTVGDPQGFDILGYYLISLLICIIYTPSLAIFAWFRKNKPLLDGALLSIVASCSIIYLYLENM